MANYLHCDYCINKEGCSDRILFDGVVVSCANHVYSRELHNEMRRKKRAEMKRIAEMDALGEQREYYLTEERRKTAKLVDEARKNGMSYGKLMEEKTRNDHNTSELRKKYLKQRCCSNGDPKPMLRCPRCRKLLESSIFLCRHCGAYFGGDMDAN